MTVKEHLREEHRRRARFHSKVAEEHELLCHHLENDHGCADCAEHHRRLVELHKAESERHEMQAEQLASPDFSEVNRHTDTMARAAGGGAFAFNQNPGMGGGRLVPRGGQPARSGQALDPEFAEVLKVEHQE